MAKLTVSGLQDWSIKLREIQDDAGGIMKAAVYAGAKVIADGIASAIDSIPEDQRYKQPGTLRASATHDEKEDLKNAIGIAHFDETGGKISTAVGFNGYSRHATKKYPQGVPLPMIARSIESGSSVRQKHPFMRRVAQSLRSEAVAAMRAAAEETYRKLGGQ